MKKINVVVVGCGFIAETAHIPNCVNLPEANLVAIVDRNTERLKLLKNRYGIADAFETHYPVLENNNIDAVIVSTPSSTHKEISIDAANAGKHVFVEKPMALSSKDAEEMIRVSEKNNSILMTGFQMPFIPSHRIAKRIARSGEIGDIFFIEAHSETLIIKPEDGILLDYGTHFFNLLAWYLEDTRIDSVAAMVDEAETRAIVNLKFENGILGKIDLFWMKDISSWSAVSRYIRILASRGVVLSEQSGPLITLYKEGSLISRLKGPHTIMSRRAINPNIPQSEVAHRQELSHFFRCIRDNKTPIVDGYSGKLAIQIAEAAKKSVQQEKFIRVEY